MSSPTLQLLTQQTRRDPNNRYFHCIAVRPDADLKFCLECPEPASVNVSSDEPMRTQEPLCEKHAYLAWAEWMANL